MGDIRILLVDDEEEFVQTLCKRINRKNGFNADFMLCGEDALQALEKKKYDVGVFDVRMPGMDGIELLERAKRMHPAMEIVILTGFASTSTGVEGMKKGAFDYLVKPTQLERLIEVINEAYEKTLKNRTGA